MHLKNRLLPFNEAVQLIEAGHWLVLAADADLLPKLPTGNWIGGSIPYFMDDAGGTKNSELIFVTDFTQVAELAEIKTYSASQLDTFLADRPSNGFSYILLPAFSAVHSQYAESMPSNSHIYDSPVIGWVTGKDLDKAEQQPIAVFGPQQKVIHDAAVVMHVALPDNQYADLEIVNCFEQGEEDEIRFFQDGFTVSDCLINGQLDNFADYLRRNAIDIQLPLVADYSGAMINTSVQKVAPEVVDFYAPVFHNEVYKLAKPIGDYAAVFAEKLYGKHEKSIAACNCILNYLYGQLEGKKTNNIRGAFTFGEIAYILLNQTMVLLSVKEI